MKTIIDKNTGLVLYCAETFYLKENETAIDELPTQAPEDETKSIYWENDKFIIK
jgi:hypothetical protein